MELTIENFGPIKKGKIKTKKVTVLIGNQGSGKSTVAKLLATFAWLEKDAYRRSNFICNVQNFYKNFTNLLEYHCIDHYLKYEPDSSLLSYAGDVAHINYESIPEDPEDCPFTLFPYKYPLPKITYFPAERSFISSIKNVKEGKNFSLWSRSLQEFKEIFQEAKERLRKSIILPINNLQIDYNRFYDTLYLKGKNYTIPLSDAASGFQSFVPLFLVADYLSKMLRSEYEMNEEDRVKFKKESADILGNPDFTDEQKRMLLSNLAGKINVNRTINIIEEPEQNMYPSSQRSVLNCLLGYNNEVKDNELIITTHSPYILSYLMLAIQAAELKEKANDNAEILSKIYNIVPEKAITPMKDVVIYELNDDGTISELPQSYGLPSDDNFLNNELGEVNSLFSKLMEIDNLCQQ